MKVSTERKAEFLNRLQALLAEYNADISWSCDPCSDTHGIYEDVITVSMGNEEVLRTEPCCGYLDARNLDELIKGMK